MGMEEPGLHRLIKAGYALLGLVITSYSIHYTKLYEVAGVGQLIKVDDRFIGLGEPVEHKIAADETGTSSNENGHDVSLARIMKCYRATKGYRE